MVKPLHMAVIAPVYNDWVSFRHLVNALENIFVSTQHTLDIYAVNDGSDEAMSAIDTANLKAIQHVEIIHLRRNVGHQRAIAMGLMTVAQTDGSLSQPDVVIVMDSDGEDRPEALPDLLAYYAQQSRPSIVVARRARRTETRVFRGFYTMYKQLFHLMVGFNIDFGNFCLLPFRDLDGLIYDPNLWNHFAATLLRSKRPLSRLSIDRGRRYDGASKMNFNGLVIHGLSALSVYFDLIITRLLIAIGVLSTFALIGMLVVVGLVLFTDLAIPGWATSAFGFLAIFLVQMLLFAGLSIFVLLYTRSHQQVVPARDMAHLVREREVTYDSTTIGH